MSIKIYSMAEMQRLLREGGFPMEAPAINSPVLSGTLVGTYNIGGTPTITQPVAFGGSGALSSPTINSPITGDNSSDVLSDADQTITSASAWDLVISPSTTRTLKWDNSFGLGASRRLTNADDTNVAILTANDDSEIGRLQPGETTTLKCISASPADDADWSVLGPGAWTAVLAYLDSSLNSQDYTTPTEFVFDASVFDYNNEFDSANGRVTPKQKGLYHIEFKVQVSGYDGSGTAFSNIRRNGSIASVGDYIERGIHANGSSGDAFFAQEGLFECDGVSDYLSVFLGMGSDTSVAFSGSGALQQMRVKRVG